MNLEELLKEIEALQRKLAEEILRELEGSGTDVDGERLEGNWSIEPLDEPGVRGFIARGYFRTPETPERLEPELPLQSLDVDPREPMHDLKENEDSVQLYIELPGVEREDIKLSHEGNSVTVDAKNFHTVIDLPEGVLYREDVSTDFRNGVLTVTIPKMKGVEL